MRSLSGVRAGTSPGRGAVHERLAADERPQVAVEGAEFRCTARKARALVTVDSILRRLRTMPGSRRSAARRRASKRATLRGSKLREGAAVAGALVQDRGPGQPRLRALQDQHLEQPAVIVHRASPLLVVVAQVERIVERRPATASLAGGLGVVGHTGALCNRR